MASDAESTRAHWRATWQALAERFERVSVTHNIGVFGVVEETVEVPRAAVVTTYHLTFPPGNIGMAKSIRWVDVLDMVGVETARRRRPRWLALNIAKARWGEVRVL